MARFTCWRFILLPILIGSVGCNSVLSSPKRPSQVAVAPTSLGSRLYLCGVFSRGKKPTLQSAYLWRDGEPTPWTWTDPSPVTESRWDWDRHKGGVIRLKKENGTFFDATWDRVGRYQFPIPGGPERINGWGWVALVPYSTNYKGYELFEGGSHLGGEDFESKIADSICSFSVRRLLTKHPQEDGLSDLIVSYSIPVNQTLGVVKQTGGSPTHGFWLQWRRKRNDKWEPKISGHSFPYAGGDSGMEWQDSLDLPRLKDVTTSEISSLPNKQISQLSSKQANTVLSNFIITPEPIYPLEIELIIRRSYGMKVIEETIQTIIKKAPSTEVDKQSK